MSCVLQPFLLALIYVFSSQDQLAQDPSAIDMFITGNKVQKPALMHCGFKNHLRLYELFSLLFPLYQVLTLLSGLLRMLTML